MLKYSLIFITMIILCPTQVALAQSEISTPIDNITIITIDEEASNSAQVNDPLHYFESGDATVPMPITKELASNCAACHGNDGSGFSEKNESLLGPSLAGQSQEYLYAQLKAYTPQKDKKGNIITDKEGKPVLQRSAPFMTQIVAFLDDSSMQNFAKMYAEHPTSFRTIQANPAVLAKGQELWRAGNPAKGVPACMSCHGPSGMGLTDLYPMLAGQKPSYIEKHLSQFRTNVRFNHIMTEIAQRMTDSEIKAVALYSGTLRPRDQ